MMAERFHKGVSHTAADNKSVALIEEVCYNADFIGNLCTAEDSNERSFRICKSSAHKGDFLLNKITANCRKISGNACC